jgi:protein-S-isoprenylcysteine O-methyltransferase Ste14
MSIRKLRLILLRTSMITVVFVAVFGGTNWPKDNLWLLIMKAAGYLCVVAGLGVRTWSILYLGGRKSREVVTEGPYSLCRNPLYLGTAMLAIGAALCFVNPLMLAMSLVILLPVHVLVILKEEEHLLELFPKDYPAYMLRVPRIWPHLANYRTGETVTISIKAIRRAAVDASGVLFIPVAAELIEILHAHGIVPVLWRFP